MTNRGSVLWKILKGLAKKWPEMIVKVTIVTTHLGESVFIKDSIMFECKKGIKVFPGGPQTILSFTKGLENHERSNMFKKTFLFPWKLRTSPVLILNQRGLHNKDWCTLILTKSSSRLILGLVQINVHQSLIGSLFSF